MITFFPIEEVYRGCHLGLIYENNIPRPAWKSTLENKWRVVVIRMQSKTRGGLELEAAAMAKKSIDTDYAIAAEEFGRGVKLDSCDREKISKEFWYETD